MRRDLVNLQSGFICPPSCRKACHSRGTCFVYVLIRTRGNLTTRCISDALLKLRLLRINLKLFFSRKWALKRISCEIIQISELNLNPIWPVSNKGAWIGVPGNREHWAKNSREQGTLGSNYGNREHRPKRSGNREHKPKKSRERGHRPKKSREQGTLAIKFKSASKH